MNNTPLMAERLESLKAGLLAGFCLMFASLLTTLINSLLQIDWHYWHWWISAGTAFFSGFLFGVTYRYIVRLDQNPQLKAGGVLAFGLVRSLAQVDIGLSEETDTIPFLVLGLENIFLFVVAAIAVDVVMQLKWIKPYS